MNTIKAFLFLICMASSLIGNSWLIIANGSPLPVSDLKACMKGRIVLALDGAVNRFKGLEIYPNFILGDFDSVADPDFWGIIATFSEIGEDDLPYQGNFGITIIPAKDQNLTDLEKAIIFCDKEKASSLLVIQAIGDRLDHTLGNIGLLKKYYRPDRNLIIQTENEQIFFVRDANIAIEGGVNETCAIMGYPQAYMTTSGLAYNGDKYLLQQAVQESTCNTIIEPIASISIQGDALIILPKSSSFKITKPFS